MRSVVLRVLLALVALTAGASSAQADFLNSIDRGWYVSTGHHDPTNTNYFVGVSGIEYRNFFVFDLSGITNPITSASFQFGATYPGSQTGTYNLYDVTTSIPSLTNGTSGVSGFNDLGTGTILGTYNITGTVAPQYLTIALNTAALDYLNDHLGGTVALGGAITGNAYLNPFSSSEIPKLVYGLGSPVPEPASLVSLGIGLASLAGARSVRRKPTAITA